MLLELVSLQTLGILTTTPNLRILEFKYNLDTDGISKLVNRALMLWRGMKIQKFTIRFAILRDKSLYGDINLWVRFAKEHQVDELYIELDYGDCRVEEFGSDPMKQTQERLYWLLQCLYSFSSLKILYLDGCNLPIPVKNVKWNQLKRLTIRGYRLSEDLMNRVLYGSPQLEFLKLYAMENHENLSIRSSSVTHLIMDKYLYFTGDIPAMDTELIIWTPNLRKLEISGVPYSKCLFNHLPFLAYANLNFHGQGVYVHHLFSWNDFVGETFRQIFPTIQYAQELVLCNWSIKVCLIWLLLSCFPFINLLLFNHHMIWIWFQLWKGPWGYEKQKYAFTFSKCQPLEAQVLPWRLRRNIAFSWDFPKLELLVLEEKDSYQSKQSAKLEVNLPDCFLQELRIVAISWAECGEEEEDSMFPFIEIMLNYARKLEKMELRVKEPKPPSNGLVSAFKKLLRMPRSSPTAQLIFSWYYSSC